VSAYRPLHGAFRCSSAHVTPVRTMFCRIDIYLPSLQLALVFLSAKMQLRYFLSSWRTRHTYLLFREHIDNVLKCLLQRGRITATFNSCWYLGSVVSAWVSNRKCCSWTTSEVFFCSQVCFGAFNHADGSQWSWRVPTLVQALCPLVQILAVWFIPESPRWLVSKGMASKNIGTIMLALSYKDCRNLRQQMFLQNITPMVATSMTL